MSFDKEAFQSYGWEQNANSPVAPDRAMAYVLALNHLLRRDNGHRRDVAGVAFVFWTREASDFDPMSVVDQADESRVAAIILAVSSDIPPVCGWLSVLQWCCSRQFSMALIVRDGRLETEGGLQIEHWRLRL